ncbi:hypothetical protein FWG95_00850 [Candidatus Saccharibacteria bacterium]|nr:hypothetical protein [Candidatus Saccharibacteria bacterium]
MDEKDQEPQEPAETYQPQQIQQPEQPQPTEPAVQNPFPFTSNAEATQNTDPINNQPFVAGPMSSNELAEISKSEKRRFDKSLQKVNVVLLVFLIITFLLASNVVVLIAQEILLHFQSGTEPVRGLPTVFVILFYGPPFIIFGIITLFVARKVRSSGEKIGRTVGIAGIVFVILFVVINVASFFYMKHGEEQGAKMAEERNQQYEQQRQQELKQKQEQRQRENERKYETISISRATELINECKLTWVFYGDATKGFDYVVSELSKNEGVVLAKDDDGNPAAIYVAERAEAELIPLAKKADEHCSNFFIIDK